MKFFMKGIMLGLAGLFAFAFVASLLSTPGAPTFTADTVAPAPVDPAPAKSRGLELRQEQQCEAEVPELARIIITARKSGASEDEVLKAFSQLPELFALSYVVDVVFDAPADSPEWMIVGEAMRECRGRGQ